MDDVTLDSPSEAFEVTFAAESLALEAVFDAASVAFEVVEAWRRADRRAIRCVCRSIVRIGADMDPQSSTKDLDKESDGYEHWQKLLSGVSSVLGSFQTLLEEVEEKLATP